MLGRDGGAVGEVVVTAAGGHRGQVRFVGQVGIAARRGHWREIRAVAQRIVISVEQGRFVNQIVITAAQSHRRQVRAVAQRVVVPVKQGRLVRQIVIIATKQYRLVAQRIIITIKQCRLISQIVVVAAEEHRFVEYLRLAGSSNPVGIHLLGRDGRLPGEVAVGTTGGHGREVGSACKIAVGSAEKVRFIRQTIIIAIEAGRQFHEAAAREVDGVVADGEYLRFRKGGHIRQVIVVAAEAIARLFRIQRVRHTQQLLHTLNGVVDAALRVNLRFQEIGTGTPVDIGENARHRRATANLHSHQPVSVGCRVMLLHIYGCTLRRTLQNGNTCRHVLVGNQDIGTVAHHGLIGHPLRCLSKQVIYGQHHDYQCENFSHI